MIISRNAIKEAVEKGDLVINPFNEENLKGASCSLTLSAKLLIPKKVSLLHISDSMERREIFMDNDGFILNPGEFILGYTEEHLILNNKYACFLSVHGSCAQAGLNILLGSHFAEPDTNNPQMLEIYNVGNSPIKLQKGMKIVKAIFSELLKGS